MSRTDQFVFRAVDDRKDDMEEERLEELKQAMMDRLREARDYQTLIISKAEGVLGSSLEFDRCAHCRITFRREKEDGNCKGFCRNCKEKHQRTKRGRLWGTDDVVDTGREAHQRYDCDTCNFFLWLDPGLPSQECPQCCSESPTAKQTRSFNDHVRLVEITRSARTGDTLTDRGITYTLFKCANPTCDYAAWLKPTRGPTDHCPRCEQPPRERKVTIAGVEVEDRSEVKGASIGWEPSSLYRRAQMHNNDLERRLNALDKELVALRAKVAKPVVVNGPPPQENRLPDPDWVPDVKWGMVFATWGMGLYLVFEVVRGLL